MVACTAFIAIPSGAYRPETNIRNGHLTIAVVCLPALLAWDIVVLSAILKFVFVVRSQLCQIIWLVTIFKFHFNALLLLMLLHF
jgi:hypothetical protein